MRLIESPTQIALSKAAIMAHWIPELGLVIEQPGRRSLHVAQWPGPPGSGMLDLHPREFRQLVHQRSRRGPVVGLAALLAGDGPITIHYLTKDFTAVEANGVVSHRLDAERCAFAFATLLDETALLRLDHPSAAIRFDGPMSISTDRDHDLGLTMVHCHQPIDDPVQMKHGSTMMFELAARCAAEEVAMVMQSGS